MKPHDWQKLILRKNENGGLAKDQNFLFQHPLERYLDFYFILQKFLRKCESFTKKCMKRANFVHERTARYVHFCFDKKIAKLSRVVFVYEILLAKFSNTHMTIFIAKKPNWFFEYFYSMSTIILIRALLIKNISWEGLRRNEKTFRDCTLTLFKSSSSLENFCKNLCKWLGSNSKNTSLEQSDSQDRELIVRQWRSPLRKKVV